MKTMLLIDGNSIINRAFYATQNTFMTNSRGVPTGAVYGFMNIYLKQVQQLAPDYVCVAFDVHRPTFRHEQYSEYKAGRKGMPEELAAQMPILKNMLKAMNVAYVECPGYEADDIIGTLSCLAKDNSVNCRILTGDRDSLQLINDYVHVLLYVTKAGHPDIIDMDIASVQEKYGVSPRMLIDVKALMGDSSDNIPGVLGIGEKTALDLISTYGCLDGVYENINCITKKALNAKLTAGKDSAYMSYELGRICLNAPIDICLNDITVREYDHKALLDILDDLELRSLKQKMGYNDKQKNSLLTQTQASEDDNGQFSLFGFAEEKDNKEEPDRQTATELLQYISENSINTVNLYVLPSDIKGQISFIDIEAGGVSCRYNVSEGASEDYNSVINILENPLISKITYDAKPLYLWMMNQGKKLDGVRFDILIAAYLADPTRKIGSLDDAARFFTHKTLVPNVFAIGVICDAAKEKLTADGLNKLFYEVEMPLIEVLAAFEYEGFRVDGDELTRQGAELDRTISQCENEIYRLAGHEFNVNSPKQLSQVLFEEMGIKPKKKTKSGYSTGMDAIEDLVDLHEIIPLIIEYRQNTKLKSTYITGLKSQINSKTGRVHSSFNQTVTATGRISSTEPNLQNIPVRSELGRMIRRAFLPAEGNVLIDADYSQIELRVLAHMANDSAMTEAFISGKDIHAATAAKVNGIDISEVTPLMRSHAKAVNFGIVYGMSDFGLAKDLDISVAAAKKYIEAYFREYSSAKAFIDTLIRDARESGFASTLMGRRRYIPEFTSAKYTIRSFGDRVARNMPIQGTAADIIKIAMVRVYNALKKGGYKSRLILQVHDSLLIDTAADEQDDVIAILRENMENAFDMSVPLKVNICSGTNWYDCK